MAVPDSLPQRVFLLAYDPDKGRVGLGTHLGAMLRAAALADLYLGGHLSDARGCAAIAVRRPCPDPVLDAVLGEIVSSSPHTWRRWVDHGQRAIVTAVRRQLGDGGWVRLEPRKILGLFPATRVTIRDPRVRKKLLRRISGALKNPIGKVEPVDAALVTIVAAGNLTLVLDGKARREREQRIQALTELSGPIGPALRESVQAAFSAEG